MHPGSPQIGRYRWRILALLFVATTINYVDRSVLGVLAPTLQYRVFHWSDRDYADINIAFKLAYAIGLVLSGSLIDRIGTRLGYALSVTIWAFFAVLHAFIRPAFGLIGFCVARFGLGLGESGNFPAAVKATAEWFPKGERAFATGLFNAGTNLGAILAPLCVPLLVSPDGAHWQRAFVATSLFSAAWLVLWLKVYRLPEDTPKLSAPELRHIRSDDPASAPTRRLPWRVLVRFRETWGFSTAKLADAVWWFYLFWGGKYLFDRFGLDIKGLAVPLITIYVVSDLGSVAGGWFSSALIRRGWTVNWARKTALLVSALCVLPVSLVTLVPTRFNADPLFYARIGAQASISAEAKEALRGLAGKSFGSAREFAQAAAAAVGPGESRIEGILLGAARSDRLYWIAVGLMALAAAGHQGWSANVFTVASDVFPKRAVGSIIGLGGTFGALAGLAADWGLGRVLSASGPKGYAFAFLIAGFSYLVFLGVLHVLIPRLQPIDEKALAAAGS